MSASELARSGAVWRKAAEREKARREERDAAIRVAAAAGQGIRAIAREVGVDPMLVLRIVRRG